jgi:hypothetical protein
MPATSITGQQIRDFSVEYSDIQQTTQGSILLGRSDAIPGVIQEILLGSNLVLNTENGTLSAIGAISAITGTDARIIINGTATNPIIDISNVYSGQTTITTLGTVTLGTWQGDVINYQYLGSNGGGTTKFLREDNTWQLLPTVPTPTLDQVLTAGNTSLSGLTIGNAKIGNATNYVNITSDGNIIFNGTSSPIVLANSYAFRYANPVNNITQYGMYFNASSGDIEVKNGSGLMVIGLNAISGVLTVTGNSVLTSANLSSTLNVTGVTTLSNLSGTGTRFVSVSPTGVLTAAPNPTTLSGYGITDAQSVLNGTGFVKISGTTISYDNTVYEPQSNKVTSLATPSDITYPTTKAVSDAINAVPTQVNADWNAVSGLAQILNKPTTISGYGITDAYTKTQIDSSLGLKANIAGVSIPSGADLNTYTSTGWYYQDLNGNAVSGTNYPSPNAGKLEVFASPSMIYQTYQVYQNSQIAEQIYYRNKYASTWSPWKQIVNSSSPTISSPTITGNGTAVTQSSTDASTKIATTAYVQNTLVSQPQNISNKWLKNSYVALNGEIFDLGMTGLYDRNELTNVDLKGTVTAVLTQGGVQTNYSASQLRAIFDGSGAFMGIPGVDGSDDSFVVDIDMLSNVNNYSHSLWQPFVAFRGYNSYNYKNISVSVSSDGTNYYSAVGWSFDASAQTFFPDSMWVGSEANPAGITGSTWRYARFTFQNPKIINGAFVYLSEIGIRHVSAPYARQYLLSAGDSMYGTLNFNIKNVTTVSIAAGTGIVTARKLSAYSISSSPVPALGTISGSFSILGSNGLYGLYSGVVSNGDTWFQAMRQDGVATAYNILLNPSGGKVGIGTASPTQTLEVVGNIKGTSFIMNGGISSQFLKADGSVDSIRYMNAINTSTSTDLNTEPARFTAWYSTPPANKPNAAQYGGAITFSYGSDNNNLQLLYDNGNSDGIGSFYFRAKNVSGWLPWHKVATTDIISTSISGATNYLSKFTSTSSIGNSSVFDNGTSIGLFTATPLAALDVNNTSYRLDTGSITKTFSVNFPDATPNQKVDFYFTGVQTFNGMIKVTVTDGFNMQNAIGYMIKVFGLGINTGGTIYNQETRYTEIEGNTADNYAISDLSWDSTNSRFKITLVHRVSTSNTPRIKFEFFSSTAALITNAATLTAGTIYTTDTTIYPRPYENFNKNVGFGVTTPTQAIHTTGNILASSFIKSGGTSSQFLKADGSVDSNIYPTSYIDYQDLRTIHPNDISSHSLRFGFTSWANAGNGSPYADYIHFGGYQDSSGGYQNLVMFKKIGIGMRIYQGAFQDTAAYSVYKDVTFIGDNVSSFANDAGYLTTASSLAWASITGKPTTLSGYGITDAQSALSGTGFVKIAGSTISYDNSTYLTTASAASTYAPLVSPTFTGTVVLPSTTSIGLITSTELGYLDGVTSSIQTQLNGKSPLAGSSSITTIGTLTAGSIPYSLLTGTPSAYSLPTASASVLGGVKIGAGITISAGVISSTPTFSAITSTPTTLAGYGITDAQSVLSGTGFVKVSGTAVSYDNSTYLTTSVAASTYAPKVSPTFTGTVVLPSTTSIGTITSTEIGYLDGVTSSIQTQLNNSFSQGALIPGSANLDTYTTTGWYIQYADSQAATGLHYPIAKAGKLEVFANTFIFQYYHVYTAFENCYFRSFYSGSWSPWRLLLDSVNYNTLAPTLLGAGASGTWNINITGNAGSVDGLSVATGVNNVANQIVRTDSSGYLQTGWINTISGVAVTPLTRIYCSQDAYLRYLSPASFVTTLNLATLTDVQTITGAKTFYDVTGYTLTFNSGTVNSYGRIRFYGGSFVNYGATIESTGAATGYDVGDFRFSTMFGGTLSESVRITGAGNLVIGKALVASYGNQQGTFNLDVGGAVNMGSSLTVSGQPTFTGIPHNASSGLDFLRMSGGQLLMRTQAETISDLGIPSKANLSSPAFTGTPTAPTAASGTSTTQIATTAFVSGGYLKLSGGILTGSLTAPAYYQSSDIRLKEIVEFSNKKSSIELIKFYLKDDINKKERYGYSAQQVEAFIPEAVNYNNDGFRELDYIQVHSVKIHELEQRIKELELIINKLSQ